MKLQQEIQDRLSKLEKIKPSADISGEGSKVAWTQNKELVKQLEAEISELQRRNAEQEQLLQTEDNLHFLQVCILLGCQLIQEKSFLYISGSGLIIQCLVFSEIPLPSDWKNMMTIHLQEPWSKVFFYFPVFSNV